jgi:hypothetical protein
MSMAVNAPKPCNTVLDTPSNCDSPQTPIVTPGLPHSNPITAISLAELLNDVVKVIQATAKVNEPQSYKSEVTNLSCISRFKTVDEMYGRS